MKNVLLAVLIFACAVGLLHAANPECVEKPCKMGFRPVCGMRVKDGRLERRLFYNYCKFQAANDCGGGYKMCEL